MSVFPRTTVGGVSLSRLLIGTNWFLGYSHSSAAKDRHIRSTMTRDKIADILEVFLAAGVDTLIGLIGNRLLAEAVEEAQDRTGRKLIVVSTPSFPLGPETPEKGFDRGEAMKVLDGEVAGGATFCMPHQGTTDAMLDRCTRTLRHFDALCGWIRERGLIPGLSTHMPEAIVYADETGLDVETYVSIYNSLGFLMQVEVDWIAKVIHTARRPVMTIKPMAAGQLRPLQGLSFAWSTIRRHDMVAVGTMTPDEARECIDISLAVIEGRHASLELQETRSKASLKTVFTY